MKIINYMFAFVAITTVGMLYDKYLKKFDIDSKETHDKLIEHYLLNGENKRDNKPVLWVHSNNEVNARNWLSFSSRNTKMVNQGYIELCINTIIKHCSKSFRICLIDDESFSSLMPNWNIDITKLADPIKSHVRQYALVNLLYKYGGMCMPNSTIVMEDVKPVMEMFLHDKDFFAVESISRNKSADSLKFIPDCNIIGARQGSDVLKELIEFWQKLISTDNTSEMDFLGRFNIKLFELYNKNEINVINGKLFGMKDRSGKEILIEDLLSSEPIQTSTNCYCIVIPKKELLKRTKYNWFTRLNTKQIMESDNNISNHLVFSLNQ